MNRKQVSF